MPDEFLISAGGFVVQAVILVALPFALLAVACRAINALQDARTAWTPAIELLSLGIGLAAGCLMLGRELDPRLLSAAEIFRPGGAWDLDFVAFLRRWGDPLTYPVQVLLPGPGASRLGPPALLLAAAVTLGPVVALRSLRGVAAGLRNLVIVLWGAAAAVYGFCLVLWLLNQLNFWAFLLVLLAIQLVRSRSEHVVVHLR
jgi:hypothetical protein